MQVRQRVNEEQGIGVHFATENGRNSVSASISPRSLRFHFPREKLLLRLLHHSKTKAKSTPEKLDNGTDVNGFHVTALKHAPSEAKVITTPVQKQTDCFYSMNVAKIEIIIRQAYRGLEHAYCHIAKTYDLGFSTYALEIN